MRSRQTVLLRFFLSHVMAILAMTWSGAAPAAEIVVVMSEDTATYREVADTIRKQLERTANVGIVDVPGLDRINRTEMRFLVAVGAKAAYALASSDHGAPLLLTLLPKSAFNRLAASKRHSTAPRPLSAIHLDQPLERQLDLIRLAIPAANRIGVLLGPESEHVYPALQIAALERRLRLAAQRVGQDSELAPALQKLLPDIDVLLALPDPVVFNAGTIQPILLTAYRHRLPLVGFSAAYVRAGAIISLHSTPSQIGRQAADMLRTALAKGQLPPPQFPRQYVVATNPHVARSLEIPIDSEQALMRRMNQSDAN